MQQALKKDIREKRFRAGGSTINPAAGKESLLSPSKNPCASSGRPYTRRLEGA
jgi:hypothetical protein